MNPLYLIIKREYLLEVQRKAFWLTTILVPLVFVAFSAFMGVMMADSELTQKIANPAAPEPDEMSPLMIAGMMCGIFLTMFLMIYGSQIYAKVKSEKCNRIVEILATCVEGRTMMLAKIISVGLVGLTQLLIWFLLGLVFVIGIIIVFDVNLPVRYLSDQRLYMIIVWSVLFFAGGYVFYGSLFAATGAMTDKDNENQVYMSILTFILLGSFYIGEFAVNHSSSAFVVFCSYFPFTSPTIGSINAITGAVGLWQSILSLVVLYVFAWISLALSGKIYTSSLLLKGKKFTLGDIMTFLKSK